MCLKKLLTTTMLCCAILIGAASCNKVKQTSEPKDGFFVVEFDSCEYVMRVDIYQGYLAHKGNCRFCAKRSEAKEKALLDSLKGNK